MTQKSYEEALKKWVRTWRDEHLSEDVRKLIKQANYDLFYGPINDGAVGDPAEEDEELSKYPGFTSACKQIRDALDDLPSDLYLDEESDEVRTSEPEHEKCEACDGEGLVDDITCEECQGNCGFEPAGTWYHAERSDILGVVVGKELAAYVR
jgi:hypothetical protein